METTSATLHALVPRASAGSHRGSSNSLSSIISTLVPVFLISCLIFAAFLILRPKFARVYNPRSLDIIVPEHDRVPTSKPGMFGWVSNYRALPDTHVLQHQSLDGYLWLRYLKMMAIMSLGGCLITWPILFPVNATGGGGQTQLDILSFSNVVNANRYYAHTFVAWIFMGFVVLLITRERVFFIGLRQAYFLTSFHAQRVSSRTVLFLGLPKDRSNEDQLRAVLGPYVRKVWMVPDCKKLQESVDNRNKLWKKLEGAEQKMILAATKKSIKAEKKHEEKSEDPFHFVDKKSRPTHRLKFLIGKKVDTIDYGRTELPKMNKEIEKEQNSTLEGQGHLMTAAFVEFSSQAAAQEAYQVHALDKKTALKPRYIGVQPSEIIWKNMGVSNGSRRTKMALATTFITLLVIFWAIPVAFVGCLSNINYLTNKVPFLSFINDIPSVILGVVTGLLPSVLLAVLMALVPIICRLLAKLAGAPTLSAVELKTQSWYFVFQVIQVFLITTFTSAASSVVTQIIQNPSSAPGLLATNLPKASNFYISYFILFGLNAAVMQLLNASPLIMIMVVGKFLDKTPRKLYNRWTSLGGLGWGSVYPAYTLLGVIAITYSCIAPLVLGFATIGFFLLYLGYRYNFLFTMGAKVDMKGESYSKGLKQLLTGVYLSVVCLIGLFAIGVAGSTAGIGPLVLMIIFLVVLVVYQIMLDRALAPLERNLPLDLLEKNEESLNIAGKVEEGLGDESSGTHLWKPSTSADARKPNFLTRWAKPQIYKSYESNKSLLKGSEAVELMPEYMSGDLEQSYQNPALHAEKPFIWLAKDNLGMSKVLLAENQKAGIDGSDSSAWVNEKGKIEWDMYNPQKAPIFEKPKMW